MTLKKCFCGRIPTALVLTHDSDREFTFATCNKCGDWSVMVKDYEKRALHHWDDSYEYEKACETWNEVQRE